jgi:leucyl aminopeptidase
MNLQVVQGDIAQFETDAIVVNLFEGVTSPGGATGAVDAALGGQIQRLISRGDFSGAAGTTALLYPDGGIPARRVLLVGLGPQEKFDYIQARRASAVAASALAALKGVLNFATIVHGAGIGGLAVEQAAQAVAVGTILATYQARQYRRQPENNRLNTCLIVEFDGAKVAQIEAGVSKGEIIGQAVCKARDLVSEPPNILYPGEMAARARRMAEDVGLRSTVLGETAMREMGMNILLAVSVGSRNEAQFVILEHAPDGHTDEPPIVLVGKGITFDTGGISIKPSAEMWRMKNDMGGAAAVIGAMEAIGRLNLPRRVIGVTPLVENMPDGAAFRPGDILTGMTGKTAEIISTDAEGRLILADALAYVARFEPAGVIDLATLTGAIGVALGSQAAGCFSNHEGLQAGLLAAAQSTGERLWPMPMYPEYVDDIKSDMAEVKNSGSRGGGVATSAKFLEHFTEGYPWAHLDIASMVWSDKGRAESPKGATGYGVQLLVEFVASDQFAG